MAHRLGFKMFLCGCVENITITVSHVTAESIDGLEFTVYLFLLYLCSSGRIQAMDASIAEVPECVNGLPGGVDHNGYPLWATQCLWDGVKVLRKILVLHDRPTTAPSPIEKLAPS
jgi:hypothetical protein